MNLHSSPDTSQPAISPRSGADDGAPGEPSETISTPPVREIGGRRDGTDPTRFGDWEKGGRCIDF